MKIVYLANIRLPSEKGQTLQTMKMIDALAGCGVFVELVVPFRFNKTMKHIKDVYSYYNIKNKDKIKITTLYIPDFMPFKSLLGHWAFRINYWFFARFASLYALLTHSDIIYSREWRVLMFLRNYKKNLIFELHDFREKDIWGYRAVSKSCLKIITITRALKDSLTSCGIDEKKIEVLPDAVDLDEVRIKADKKEARERVNLPLDEKLVVYTGHLYEWKGIDVMIDAWKHLQGDNIKLILAGGMEEDIRRIKMHIFSEDIKNVLIVGFVPYNLIPYYLKSADFLILSANKKYEIAEKYTSPLKLFQYLASRVPVIAPKTSAMLEVLDETTAYLFDGDSPESLADIVRQAFVDLDKNHDKIKKMTEKGYEIAKQNTWQKRARRIVKFIQNSFTSDRGLI